MFLIGKVNEVRNVIQMMCTALAIVAVCGLLTTLGFLGTIAEGASPLSDNFDSYAIGAPPVPPWQEKYSGDGGVPVDGGRDEAATLGVTINVDNATAVSSPNSVHFLDTTGSYSGQIYRTFPSTSVIVLEYYMRTHNDSAEGAFVRLRGDAGWGYAVAFSNGVFGSQAGWIGINGSPAGWVKPDLLEYDVDTWYYVRRELNCTTDTGSFYVEEMGNPSNNASYSIGRNDANTYLNEIDIYSSCSQEADCYIDDVVITPEPATLSLLALGGLAVLRRRRTQ